MGRRKIVVEDTTYHWETDGYNIAIIPPKGTGGTRRYCVETEFGCSEFDHFYSYCGESRVAVTPGAIASLIYRDILKKPVSQKKCVVRPITSRKPPTIRHWNTAPELPRTYLVQAMVTLPEGRETSIPLEVHETAETAREAALRLNHTQTTGLIEKALKLPEADVVKTYRGDETHAVKVLVEWLRTMPLQGAQPQLRVWVSEVPFKIAA